MAFQSKDLISIIIPTFNEVGNIQRLLDEISKTLVQYRFEIIVVDDESTDGTFNLVKDYSTKNKNIKVFTHNAPRDLSQSIILGIQESRGTFIIGMDADFNHHPRHLIPMLQALKTADIVVGTRFINGGGMEDKWRFLTSYLFNVLLQFFFQFPVHDNTSGFYAVKRNKLFMLDMKEIYQGYGDYHLRLVYWAKKSAFVIKEVPVYYPNRTSGRSKSKFLEMFFSYLKVAYSLSSK
ncbi:MAG: glycosyltransferase [Patescibacteria group bacterium]